MVSAINLNISKQGNSYFQTFSDSLTKNNELHQRKCSFQTICPLISKTINDSFFKKGTLFFKEKKSTCK